jgi:hypothetical protein
MSNEPNPPTCSDLQRGIELFHKGEYYRALGRFAGYTNLWPVTEDVVIALQMSGVIYRRLKPAQLDASLRVLEEALTKARELKNSRLEASINKDLESTVHARQQSRRFKKKD